ncbi:MAG: UPF0182 family protein [Armatimonadetes bacterium]|nr:UPF0182 family protein [Armatimonadota bacterium]
MDDGTYRLIPENGQIAKARKGGIKLLVIFAVVVLLFSFGSKLLEFYTDWLWFKFDAMQEQVFIKKISAQVVLWLIGMSVTFVAIYLNARAALKSDSVFDTIPADENARAAANVLSALQKFGRLLALGAALVVGYGMASALSAAYREYWAFTAAMPFDKVDPLFGLDLSFFVFKLPWYMTVSNTLVSILVVTLVVTVGGYLGSRALAGVAKVQLAQGPMRAHVSILGGLTIIVFGARMFLARYLMGIQQSEQFTGPGYSQEKVIQFYAVIGGLTMLVGVLTLLNAKMWKPWRVPMLGLPALAVTGMILFGLVPGFIQRIQVDRNVLALEAPFAKFAIDSTRFAYGLDRFEIRSDFKVAAQPTSAEVAASQSSLQSMRLWDPSVLQSIFGEKQAIAAFYEFYDVDIDRYTIDGEQRLVMLGPRDVNFEGIAEGSRNWPNRHLVYTHGFGVVAVPADESINGMPNYWYSNFPPNQGTHFKLDQQRLYFSQFPPGSSERTGYILLKSKQEELDYPSDVVKHMHTWEGRRGVPISGAMTKFAYSVLKSNIDLYTSKDITDETRMVYRRDIMDRASLIYPFLRFDTDPYIALVGGRIIWIMDAYTVSNQIPYSEFLPTGLGSINYIRNSVKIVVDAYDGEMTAYAIEEDEPILKTWMKIFPGLVRPASEVSSEVRAHFRYAEGLFQAQAEVLTQYHVTDAVKFLNNEDAWQIPQEIGRRGGRENITPYYVQMRLPGEDQDGFMLILPFSPRTKNNMIGWMAAMCDPEDYGRVVLYKFPRDTQTQGPLQMEAKFAADPFVADINRQFNNEQSDIVPGNLLVIPIGSSLLYVKPLYLQSKSRAIPELRKVILGLQNRVVVADTYDEALEMLFGRVTTAVIEPGDIDRAPPSGVTAGTESPKPVAAERSGLPPDTAQALKLMDDAEAALRRGDLASYQDLNRQAREILRGLGQ